MDEKEIILRTLQQIQEETDKVIKERKKQVKDDGSIKDSVINIQIDTLCLVDIIVGRVACKNGIEIEVKLREEV